MARTHIILPDTQAKPGAPTDHLGWIGNYLVDHFHHLPAEDLEIIHLGDHADMPSLSHWDKGRKAMEGRRYNDDIKAAEDAWDILCTPLDRYNAQQAVSKHKLWWPSRRIVLGNHEDRITRACEEDSRLEGTMSLDDLPYENFGWTVHPFLEPVTVDGVTYCHFFFNPMTGRPYSGASVDTRLKNIGHSFSMGHQQTLMYGLRFVGGRSQHGLVAGACYLHDEDYKQGVQGNAHWRGIIVKHQVENGSYDPMFVSLDYLCRRYEGKTLSQFMGRTWAFA